MQNRLNCWMILDNFANAVFDAPFVFGDVDLFARIADGNKAAELRASPENLHKAYGIKVGSFLGFLKYVLGLDTLPDYETVVQSAFEKHIAEHRYGGDQISFLRAVRSVFLSKRALQTADLYEPPLTQFGRNAADRLFTPVEINQLIALTNQLAA